MGRKKNQSKKVYKCEICEDTEEDKPVVACDNCDKWHHFSCVGINSIGKNETWFCPLCKANRFDTRSPSRRQENIDTTLPSNVKQITPQISAQRNPTTPVPESLTLPSNDQRNIEQFSTNRELDRRRHRSTSSRNTRTTKVTSRRQEIELETIEEERMLQERRDYHYLEQKYRVLMQRGRESDKHSVASIRQQCISVECRSRRRIQQFHQSLQKLSLKMHEVEHLEICGERYCYGRKSIVQSLSKFIDTRNISQVITKAASSVKQNPGEEARVLNGTRIPTSRLLQNLKQIQFTSQAKDSATANPEDRSSFCKRLENNFRFPGISNDEKLERLQCCLQWCAKNTEKLQDLIFQLILRVWYTQLELNLFCEFGERVRISTITILAAQPNQKCQLVQRFDFFHRRIYFKGLQVPLQHRCFRIELTPNSPAQELREVSANQLEQQSSSVRFTVCQQMHLQVELLMKSSQFVRKQNVADEATKRTKTPSFHKNNRWFPGPEFLKLPREEWPGDKVDIEPDTLEEMKVHFAHFKLLVPILIDTTRISSWNKMHRAVAFARRYILILRAKVHKMNIPKGPLTRDELIVAEKLIFRQAQYEQFTEEIVILKRNQEVHRSRQKEIRESSPIYKCSPYLDEIGLLRVHGRIDLAPNVSYDTKRPIILPRNSKITHLLVAHYHRIYHHHNHRTVYNEIRQKFYIPRLRTVLNLVKKDCQKCKNRRAKPQPPEMADLPAARLAIGFRPFTFIGIDYFGPMYVTSGRKTEKRWGVMITCLTIRAIHLDIVYSLDTDSAIRCVRNFINTRGRPEEIYSDQGTNFKGMDNELKRLISEIDVNRMATEFTTCYTKWCFNPPASPHMSGSWERMIKSVKICLDEILP